MKDEYQFDKAPAGPANGIKKAALGYFVCIALIAAATVGFAAVSFAISP